MAHKAEEEAQTKMLIYWFGVFAAVWPSKHNFNGFKHQVGLERWQKIVEEFAANPHDVKTMPTNRRASKWFYVYVEKNSLYVDKSPNVPPDDSCKYRSGVFCAPASWKICGCFINAGRMGKMFSGKQRSVAVIKSIGMGYLPI